MTFNDNREQSPGKRNQDDSYWSALFEQVDATQVPTPETAVPWADMSVVPAKNIPHAPPTLSATSENPWSLAATAMDSNENVDLTVTGYNKGGLLAYWNGLQGFIPASQLVDFPQFHLESERLRALREWVDKSLQVRIIEINPDLNRLIFSERAAQVNPNDRDALLHELKPGKRTEGIITNLTDFGAFVDLGGIEGLIHISELSWSRVTHPSRVVKPQQKVTVLILSIDAHNQRIALSRKRLRRNPWQGVEERYQPGQLVSGIVSNVVNFGAFVQLEEELEGLIHISELAEGTFLHPRNVVKKGETITARVLNVSSAEKRLALSLRQITPSTNGHM